MLSLAEKRKQSASPEPAKQQPERTAAPAGSRSPARHLGPGAPLPAASRAPLEQSFGTLLDGLRIHNDERAAAAADRQNANAFAFGRDLVFGRGKFAPGTPSGNRLLAHEVTHSLQQEGAGSAGASTAGTSILEAEAQAAGGLAATGAPVGRLSPSIPRALRDPKAEKEPPLLLQGSLSLATRDGVAMTFPSAASMKKTMRTASDPDVIDECTVEQIGPSATPGMMYRFVHPVLGRIVDVVADDASGGGWGVKYYWLPPEPTSGDGKAGGAKDGSGGGKATHPGGDGGKAGGSAGGAGGGKATSQGGAGKAGSSVHVPTSTENARAKTPAQVLAPAGKPTQDPEQATSLYQQIQERLPSSPDGGGEEAVRFAHFLELNKDKIEGILPPGKKGKGITEAQIQQILDMYGKFIIATPLDMPDKLEKPEDYDKTFVYDPNWQKMSKQDRQMMIDFSKMDPQDLLAKKLDTSVLTTPMKEEMAMKLADSWPAEILEAAKAAFTDPGFLISLVLTIAIYIGLWLTPDPTFITKLAAGTLTVVMWSMFAWNDIWETMVAWDDFGDNCKKARTAEELKAAGNALAKKIGAVGFDILMMIATWGLGKAASPKLKAMGAERGVARAEGLRSAAAADPAAGVPKAAQGPAAALLDGAKTNAKGSTATAVLDALEPTLDPAAKQGLKAMRASGAGDAGTYNALEGQTGRGSDINHYLAEKAATPDARIGAKAKLLDAEAKVARAKLIQTETIQDPKLRADARAAAMKDNVLRFKLRLKEMGLLDDPKVTDAVRQQNMKDLTGILGEAIARQQLQASVAGTPGAKVVSNLAIVEDVPGYKTIDAWKQATGATPDKVAKMYQGDGKIYQGLGEIDNMVVEDVPSGKPRATIVEEAKTGASDSPTKALDQVTKKVLPGLERVANGDPSVKVFELIGKKQLGADHTGTYDYSGSINAQTRGPAGKGFHNSLGFDPEVLDATAKSLIEDGLPRSGGPTMVPLKPTDSKDEDKGK